MHSARRGDSVQLVGYTEVILIVGAPCNFAAISDGTSERVAGDFYNNHAHETGAAAPPLQHSKQGGPVVGGVAGCAYGWLCMPAVACARAWLFQRGDLPVERQVSASGVTRPSAFRRPFLNTWRLTVTELPWLKSTRSSR
jgi:hypothetical protein